MANCNFIKSGKEFVVESHEEREIFDKAIDLFFRLFCFCWKSDFSHHFFQMVKELFVIAVFFGKLIDRKGNIADFISLNWLQRYLNVINSFGFLTDKISDQKESLYFAFILNKRMCLNVKKSYFFQVLSILDVILQSSVSYFLCGC